MGAVLGVMKCMLEKLRETARVMAGKWIDYVPEKSKEFLGVRLHFGKICIGNVLDEVFPPLQHFGKICIPKLDDIFPTLQHFVKICIPKLDDIFPTLQHFGRICVAKVTEVFPLLRPYIIAAVVIWILLRFFPGGGRSAVIMIMKVPVSVAKMMTQMMKVPVSVVKMMKGPASVVKMMVAPGTRGALRIARAPFEASPRLYFRDLRRK